MMEEFQEADVLWPWRDTPPPPPSSSSEGSYDNDDLPAEAPELYAYDDAAAAVVAFSCEPFSGSAASWSWSASSTSSTLSALLLLSSDWSDDGAGGFFLSGASPVSAELDATEESFLEADVLWPDDTDDDDAAAGFLWRRGRRSRRVVEEAAAASAAAAAVFCGKREGCSGGPLVVASSPIDIPMATRGAAAAAAGRRRGP